MSIKLTILGSSAALPAYGRFPSSQFLQIQNHNFLIDCGEGTQSQLMRFAIGIHKINHVFISHLHGDHYLGLTGLIFSMHLQQRDADLHLFSFRGLEEILVAQLKHARSVLNFKIVFHPLTEDRREVIFEDDHLTVETIPLDHKIATNGFLFREKPKGLRIDKSKLKPGMSVPQVRQLKEGQDVFDESNQVLYRSRDVTLAPRHALSYAYCSDTQPSDKILTQIEGADLLYHEATFLEDEKDKARQTRHSTAAEAAEIARKANVRRLVIGHFSARYKDLAPALAEAQRHFAATELAREGETIEIHD